RDPYLQCRRGHASTLSLARSYLKCATRCRRACKNAGIMWTEVGRIRQAIRRAAASAVPAGLLVRHGPRSSNGVALTFDDGPDEQTGELLDLLDELAVRATFFLVGDACERFPSSVRDIVARGHEIGSHGYSHALFTSLSGEALLAELRTMETLLPPQPRRRPIVRPPHGTVSAQSLLRCARAGYTTVLWSLDSLDYRTTEPGAIAAWIGEERGGAVVLLHEFEPATRAALRPAVESLRRRGLELGTVFELIGD